MKTVLLLTTSLTALIIAANTATATLVATEEETAVPFEPLYPDNYDAAAVEDIRDLRYARARAIGYSETEGGVEARAELLRGADISMEEEAAGAEGARAMGMRAARFDDGGMEKEARRAELRMDDTARANQLGIPIP